MLSLLMSLPALAADAGLTAGLVAGGPGAGVILSADRAAPHLYLSAGLTVAVHQRSYGTRGPLLALPDALVAVPFGGRIAAGPALRIDALAGARDEQMASTGSGARYAAALEDPFLLAAYPSAGALLRATGERGSELVASLTFGLPFMSFDVLFPTAPTPAFAWTLPSGWRWGARATRYQATVEIGHTL